MAPALLIAAAQAATLTVDPDDASAYASVAEAVSAAESGDSIEVVAGTYSECLDTSGKSLTLRGDGEVALEASCDPLLSVYSGETIVLEDLTLTSSTGRTVYLYWSTIEASNVSFVDSGTGTVDGGAIWAYGGSLTTEDCTFEGNSGVYGGAIYFYGYETWADSGSVFDGNAASGAGGAVFANYDQTITLDGTTFSANTSAGSGGGLWAGWYGDLTATGLVVVGNSATTSGGGITTYVDETVSITDSTFSENTAGTNGGALDLEWVTTGTVSGNAVTFNTASSASSGGGLFVYVATALTLDDNLFCANDGGYGGGASVQWTDADTWTRNRFVDNVGVYGGGAYRYASYVGVIEHNSFAGDQGTEDGGAYYASYGYADFSHNIVAHVPDGNGIYASDAYSAANSAVTYDGWADNSVLDGGGYFYLDPDAGHVVADDPGFVAYAADGVCDDDLRPGRGLALQGRRSRRRGRPGRQRRRPRCLWGRGRRRGRSGRRWLRHHSGLRRHLGDQPPGRRGALRRSRQRL